MSTRSTIAIRRLDGSMTKVYCHWDGYVEYNGFMLQKYYNTPDKIEELLKLGALSSLGERVNPIGEHSFEHSEEGTTVAYHRDRGEELSFCENSQEEEYNYVFNCFDGEWYVTYGEYKSGDEISPAAKMLGDNYTCINTTKLLLDGILEADLTHSCFTDEDKEICIEKAKEGKKVAEEQREEYFNTPLF